jgi:predicted histone-like DNA-binding protein
MSLNYKLTKSNMKGKSNGRYYAKAVTFGEIHIDELAQKLSHSSTVTEGDVKAVITDLVNLMKYELASSKTVVLDGFGRFKLAIDSDTVATPAEFNAGRHIKGLRCKFIAEGKRGNIGGKGRLKKVFTEGVECVPAPINDRRIHD